MEATRTENEVTCTASVQVIRVIDDNGEDVLTPFEDIPKEEFSEDSEEYVQVVDMAFDSHVVPSSEYDQFMEYRRRLQESDKNEEGSVSFKLPRRVGWGIIFTVSFFLLQGIVWSVIAYNSQMNFNERALDSLKEIEEEQNRLSSNVYTRKEEDLRYENLRVEIIKNKELLDMVSKKVGDNTDVYK